VAHFLPQGSFNRFNLLVIKMPLKSEITNKQASQNVHFLVLSMLSLKNKLFALIFIKIPFKGLITDKQACRASVTLQIFTF
jgi:hypothetical protein